MQRNYKIRGLVVKMVEEIFMESQKLYESMTQDTKLPADKQCVVLIPVVKPAEAAEGEEVVAPPVSLKDILAFIKSDAAEKGVTTELTLAALHDFFAAKVGRKIAVDGALVNFAPMLPAEITMEI